MKPIQKLGSGMPKEKVDQIPEEQTIDYTGYLEPLRTTARC
jgi:hypothetical protein